MKITEPTVQPRRVSPRVLALGVAVLVMGGALVLGVGALGLGSSGTLAPGLSVGGTAVGGLSHEAALARLQGNRAPEPQVSVRLDVGTRTAGDAGGPRWQVGARQLGWSEDPAAELRTAVQISRGRGVLERLRDVLGQAPAHDLPRVFRVDARQATRALGELTAAQNTAPRNAGAVFQAGRYVLRPGQAGVLVKVGAAVQQFVQHPELQTLSLQRALARPAVDDAQVQALIQQANARVRPLSVRLGDGGPAFTLSPVQVANLFWVRRGGLELDRDALNIMVKQVQEAVDTPAQDARYTLKGGLLVKVREQPGVVSDAAEVSERLGAAVLDPGVSAVVLTPTPSVPALTLAQLPDASTLTLIATGTSTYYHSSPARRVNVANAAMKMNGAVVAPGGEFSFLKTLGGISPENGFVTGLIISAGRTVDGLGGGVCQVSTTTFRALYQAGLPVIERNQHAYRVGYYEPQVGYEAAVYDPGRDLRLKNDTGGPIVLNTINDNARSRLTVQVWGLPQMRTVQVSPAVILSRVAHPAPRYVPTTALPHGAARQVDWAADGYSLYITRTIKQGGQVHTDRTETVYKPWQAVYEVGQ